MFFTELALKNPSIPSKQLVDIIYKTVGGEKGGVYLRSIIKGYVNFIHEKIEKYFNIIFGEDTLVTNDKVYAIRRVFNPRFGSLVSHFFNKLIEIEIFLINKVGFDRDADAYLKEQIRMIDENLKLKTNDQLENEKLLIEKRIYENIRHIGNSPSLTKTSLQDVLPVEPLLSMVTPDYVTPMTSPPKRIPLPPPKKKTKTQKQKANDDITIKPCPEGQERHPVTKRCRKIKKVTKTASSQRINVNRLDLLEPQPQPQPILLPVKALKPCPEGKVRNPATGRCIKDKTLKKGKSGGMKTRTRSKSF
jgi:hypothetical protein